MYQQCFYLFAISLAKLVDEFCQPGQLNAGGRVGPQVSNRFTHFTYIVITHSEEVGVYPLEHQIFYRITFKKLKL